jgi:hypothetical protein
LRNSSFGIRRLMTKRPVEIDAQWRKHEGGFDGSWPKGLSSQCGRALPQFIPPGGRGDEAQN